MHTFLVAILTITSLYTVQPVGLAGLATGTPDICLRSTLIESAQCHIDQAEIKTRAVRIVLCSAHDCSVVISDCLLKSRAESALLDQKLLTATETKQISGVRCRGLK